MDAVDELAAAVGVAQACRVLGVPRSSHYRARQVDEALLPAPKERPAPARSLSAEERETLLAGIAHEVRNPLGALDLFAGLLAEELQGRPEEEAHVARIRSELAALSKVVEEFLDYARTRPPVREEVGLGRLLAEVVELSAPLATARQVALSSEGDGAVRADREQLRRALLNLVRNAVEAAPAGSAVELFARSGEAEVVIEVRDRGPGLGPEAREGLFRPFFTTKERGTGLGLALAKKVADAHGGALELLDREGGGTVARLAVVDAAPRMPFRLG